MTKKRRFASLDTDENVKSIGGRMMFIYFFLEQIVELTKNSDVYMFTVFRAVYNK